MATKFTLKDIINSPAGRLNPHLTEEAPEEKEKKNKFGNTPTEVNGIKFQSIKEAKRYKDLLLLLKVGKIGLLRRQVPYQLNDGGKFSFEYLADFVYYDLEAQPVVEVVEDAKGLRTREYKKKKRLMKKIYGIEILET